MKVRMLGGILIVMTVIAFLIGNYYRASNQLQTDKETDKLLREILIELRQLNASNSRITKGKNYVGPAQEEHK